MMLWGASSWLALAQTFGNPVYEATVVMILDDYETEQIANEQNNYNSTTYHREVELKIPGDKESIVMTFSNTNRSALPDVNDVIKIKQNSNEKWFQASESVNFGIGSVILLFLGGAMFFGAISGKVSTGNSVK